MKKILSLLLAVSLVACTQDFEEKIESAEQAESATIIYSPESAVRGEIVVKFNPEAENALTKVASRCGATRSGVVGVDEILESIGATAVEPVFVVTERNSECVKSAGLHLWYKLSFDESADLESVANRLAKVAEVNTVQYNITVKRAYKDRAVAMGEVWGDNAAPREAATRGVTFNDSYLGYQWHYINTGNTSVTSPTKEGCDVNCDSAWQLCAGDASVIVAVVDEGVMYSHPDLAANMWVNTAEKNGSSSKDDDGNGYKDDIYGFNFVSSTGTISWDNSDDTGHGTHVGGTVAAVNNNGVGVCGIAGGSGNGDGVKIMSCQIFSGNNGATTSNTAKAIQYAADNGAVVLQCSWGYDSGEIKNDTTFKSYCSVEKAAIDYFIANAGSDNGPIKGGIAVFAAGNEYASMPGYPGAYEPCVSVAALSADFTPASFSNYGKGVDICAPGGDSDYAKSASGTILSTIPDSSGSSGTYGYMEGTSMACPHVSGVAALGLSYAAKLGKHFTASEFRSMLLTSVMDINQYMTGTKTYYYYYDYYGTSDKRTMTLSNYNKNMGSGYADAYMLLLQVEGTPCIIVEAASDVARTIDLTNYFGGGASALKFTDSAVSDADKEAVGMTTFLRSGSKLYVVCTKPGVAKITVTALVGGTSTGETSAPSATEVSKSFALVVTGGAASNGGWL